MPLSFDATSYKAPTQVAKFHAAFIRPMPTNKMVEYGYPEGTEELVLQWEPVGFTLPDGQEYQEDYIRISNSNQSSCFRFVQQAGKFIKENFQVGLKELEELNILLAGRYVRKSKPPLNPQRISGGSYLSLDELVSDEEVANIRAAKQPRSAEGGSGVTVVPLDPIALLQALVGTEPFTVDDARKQLVNNGQRAAATKIGPLLNALATSGGLTVREDNSMVFAG
jgi:hypothetical protein